MRRIRANGQNLRGGVHPDDGNECTDDFCQSLQGCFSVPKDCDDESFCTVDRCDIQIGFCINEPEDCDEEAKFMKRALELLGVPGGAPYLTWPSLDCDPTEQTIRTAAQAGIDWDIDGDGQIGEEMLVLRFDFDGGAGTNINAFEGSLAFPSLGWYYAVWPSLKAQSKCELLLEVEIHPLYTDPNAKKVIQCWATLESPWECIINPTTGETETEPFPACVNGCP